MWKEGGLGVGLATQPHKNFNCYWNSKKNFNYFWSAQWKLNFIRWQCQGQSKLTPVAETIFQITRIGTWNVQTLYQNGHLTQLSWIFSDYWLDRYLGYQWPWPTLTRWTGNGWMISNSSVILYVGHEEWHKHRVGLVLNKKAAKELITWKPVNELILTACFTYRHTKATVVQAYAPTDSAHDTRKKKFSEQIQDILDDAPNHELTVLIGDFN